MRTNGVLLNCEEATRLIEQIDDPVTKNLVNMAFVRFVKETNLAKTVKPSCDFDMEYFVRVLSDYFSEHDVIAADLSWRKSRGLVPERTIAIIFQNQAV